MPPSIEERPVILRWGRPESSTNEAVAATPTDDTGFMCPVGLRQTGGAHKLRLEQKSGSDTWRFERAVVFLKPTSRRRKC